jgi:acetolactate synthase-1/3 small subunit
MKRIISILLENESGALSRVVGLFAQRGYNIDTLTVAPTDDDTLSRLTLTTQGDDHMAEQIVKQLHKLIDTIKVVDLTVGSHIERELMLVKIKATENDIRAELKSCVEIFRGHIVDVTPQTYTVQLVGDSEKLDAFIEAVGDMGIMEVVRSGISGISRGDKFLRV